MKEIDQLFQSAEPILQNIPFALIVLNQKAEVVHWNRQAEKLFGYTAEETLHKFVPFIKDEDASKYAEMWKNVLYSHESITLDTITFKGKNNLSVTAETSAKSFSISNERFVFFRFDIEKDFAKEPSITQQLHCLRDGLEESFMVLGLDSEGLINYTNQEFLKYSNWTPKRIIGKTFWQMFPQTSEGTKVADTIWNTLRNNATWQGEIEQLTKDGQPYWVDLTAIPVISAEGVPHSFLLFEKDITEKKLLQNKLEKIAYIDQETGLMNRYRLEQVINKMIDEKQHFTFVYFSIDKFFSLKEIYGNRTEAELLQEFTNRMKIYFQDSTMARVNINEFVVITPLGEWFIQGFLSYLNQNPIYIANTATTISISGGITKYPEDQSTFNHLLKASYTVIQKIQSEGGGGIMSLSKTDHKALSQRALIEKRLLIALNQKDLNVLYQPLRNLQTNEIYAAEAFVRWEDEEIGIVPPDVLIPIAEETGLINEIGQYMLEKACAQAVKWQKKGINLKVSVNSSVREFRDKNMVQKIRQVLEDTGCPAKLLQIEITEKFALEAEAESSIIQQMITLQADGVTFVLDDFGTGYASFRYMQLLPIEEVKVDQTFISSFTYQEKTQKLIQGMIQFGHSLNLKVIAEGVESREQLDLLQSFGCDSVQGYYIARPGSPLDIEKLYKTTQK